MTTTRRHPSIARFGDSWSDCSRKSSSVRRCGSRGWLWCQKRAGSGHPTTRSTLSIKGTYPKTQGSSHHVLAYRTSTPVSSEYLESSRSSAPSTLTKLRPHQQALRDMTRCKHSLKKHNQIIMSQQGRGLWQGLNTACNHCLRGGHVHERASVGDEVSL